MKNIVGANVMLEVFYNIEKTLNEMRDLMISMNKHLKDLTMPPDLRRWSINQKRKRDIK